MIVIVLGIRKFTSNFVLITFKSSLVFAWIWSLDGDKSMWFYTVLPNHDCNKQVFHWKRGSKEIQILWFPLCWGLGGLSWFSIFVFTHRSSLVFTQIWSPNGDKSFCFHKVSPNHAYNKRVLNPKGEVKRDWSHLKNTCGQRNSYARLFSSTWYWCKGST